MMMKQYSDGKRIINATEKAFNLIYSAQGFKEIDSKKSTINPKNEEDKKDDVKKSQKTNTNPKNKKEGKGTEK